MRKTLFYILLGIVSLQLICCTAQTTVVSSSGNRICSVCNGRGYVTDQDRMYWPNIVLVNIRCMYCQGKGYVYEPYFYLENGRIIYNYPYHKRPAVKPHYPIPPHKPQPPKVGHNRNGIPGKAPDVKPNKPRKDPGHDRNNHNFGGRR